MTSTVIADEWFEEPKIAPQTTGELPADAGNRVAPREILIFPLVPDGARVFLSYYSRIKEMEVVCRFAKFLPRSIFLLRSGRF